MKTPLAVDSICFLFGVVSLDFEKEVIRILREHEAEISKNERQKIADEVKSLKISDITTAETIHKAILDGGK